MEQFEETEKRDADQYETDAPPSTVTTEIIGKACQHASHHSVLHIAIEPFRCRSFLRYLFTI